MIKKNKNKKTKHEKIYILPRESHTTAFYKNKQTNKINSMAIRSASSRDHYTKRCNFIVIMKNLKKLCKYVIVNIKNNTQ